MSDYDRKKMIAFLSYGSNHHISGEHAKAIANDLKKVQRNEDVVDRLLTALDKIASDDPINPEMGNQGVDADRMSSLAREALK